jgi:Mss4 protein
MIKNHMREYDKMNTYWFVDTIDKFQNIEIHGIMGDIKYLCCISCQSEVIGYWLISDPTQIYIACPRVQLEV